MFRVNMSGYCSSQVQETVRMAASSRKLVLTCGSVVKGCVKSALFSNSMRGFHLAAPTSRLPSSYALRPESSAVHRLNPVILSRGIHVSRATGAMTKGLA